MGLSTDIIPIEEEFISVQGEGINIGHPYYFIRVAGCPLRCNFCDTERSWTADKSQLQKVDDVVERAIDECKRRHIKWVSITGGEPLLYPKQLLRIVSLLNQYGIYSHVETSGRFYDEAVHYACSLYSPDAKTPCTGETMRGYFTGLENMRHVDQVKCLISDDVDLKYAHTVNVALAGRCTMVLQPFNTGIVTKSTVHMTDNLIRVIPSEQPQSHQLRMQLCNGLRWLMETFHSRCNAGELWQKTIITPQMHVLAFGNEKSR